MQAFISPRRHPACRGLNSCSWRWQCKLRTSGLGRTLRAARGTRVELAGTNKFILSCNRDDGFRPGWVQRCEWCHRDSVSLCLLAPSPSGSSLPTPLAPAQPVRTHVGWTSFHNPSPQTESRRPGWGHVSLPKPSPGIRVARSGVCTLCAGVGWATSATAIKSKGAMGLQKKGGGRPSWSTPRRPLAPLTHALMKSGMRLGAVEPPPAPGEGRSRRWYEASSQDA